MTTYSRNSAYLTNLRTLLSSLSSNRPSFSTGFYSTSAGRSPDVVSGRFLCRGDVTPEVCRSCVAFLVKVTFNRCPNEKQVTLYYYECMLIYSDRNILLNSSLESGLIEWNPQNVISNQTQFINLVSSTMNQSAVEAASSSRNLDARKANFTAFRTIYVLVQCTPDLTRQECLSCLQQNINQLASDKIGGEVLGYCRG
ncbi:unnamed protein product [Microthlaspi erraticum]|uniref:Gnk2-homologous domain-containing protein n=1 Tax=Microthlaspi erraticum TaxID=1685480 RepID=A0A6D2JZM1_9BRAS|nr:unnamed protein product [Microthlaspi erraticum]